MYGFGESIGVWFIVYMDALDGVYDLSLGIGIRKLGVLRGGCR